MPIKNVQKIVAKWKKNGRRNFLALQNWERTTSGYQVQKKLQSLKVHQMIAANFHAANWKQ